MNLLFFQMHQKHYSTPTHYYEGVASLLVILTWVQSGAGGSLKKAQLHLAMFLNCLEMETYLIIYHHRT